MNPNLEKAIRLAGEDRSFFISCIPHSSEREPGVDTAVWAKGLKWAKELSDGSGRWQTVGDRTGDRVHVEASADGLGFDLVFRSIRPDDKGNYACEAELDGQLERTQFELKVIGILYVLN